MVDFKNMSSYEHRLLYFEDREIVSRVDKEKAGRLAPKVKEWRKLIEACASVWSVDGRKFLFLFSEINEEGQQMVSVWGLKGNGYYQRIKTVWISCPDYIFEAVGVFVNQYFELGIEPSEFVVDAEWFYALVDGLKLFARRCPDYLKPKLKLLKVRSEIMPKFNEMVADLDLIILTHTSMIDEEQHIGALYRTSGSDKCTHIIEDRTFGLRENRMSGSSFMDKGSRRDSISGKTGTQDDRMIDILDSIKNTSQGGLAKEMNEENPAIIRSSEEIIAGIDLDKSQDLDLWYAVQLYTYSKIVRLVSDRRSDDAGVCGNQLIERSRNLLAKLVQGEIEQKELPKTMDILALTPAFGSLMKYEDIIKPMGKVFQINLEKAMSQKEERSLGYLELMVYTRRYNKRLPKSLSDEIKFVLHTMVPSIGNFWEEIPGCDTLLGKLRQLWIQCMSLCLYHYSPSHSYTVRELEALIPEILESDDPDVILQCVRLYHDCDFYRVRIRKFEEMIDAALASATNDIDILKLSAAKLLYKAYLKKRPLPAKDINVSEEDIASIPSGLIGQPSDQNIYTSDLDVLSSIFNSNPSNPKALSEARSPL